MTDVPHSTRLLRPCGAQYARNASKTWKRTPPRTQRRSESDATSPLLLPGSGSLQTQSTSTSRRSKLSVSFAFFRLGPPPPLGSSLAFVHDGGVIPHRCLISTIPTTAVTPHNNSDTPWGDSGLARSMSDMRVSPSASHRAGGPGDMVTGESDQAGARPYAPNGKAHPSMEKAIADGRAANKSSRRRH